MLDLTALLVDDDEDQMIFVRDLLQSGPLRGCTLHWAVSGAEALERLRDDGIDVALVDYRLGAENGLDVVREARRTGYDTPMIVLTGQGGRAVDLAAMSAGADDFLDKLTLTPDGLERAIRYAMKGVKAQRALRESEEHFRALIEHASDAILLVDAAEHVIFASDSFRREAGYSPESVIDSNVFANVHPDDLAEVRHRFAECRQQPGAEVRTEYRSLHADGSWRHREIVAVNRLDEPALRAIVVNYRDITARRLAEAQRVHLAALVESAQDSIVGMSIDGIVESWNHGAEALFGYPANEMLGQEVDRIVPPEHRAELHALRRRIAGGEHVANHLTERIRRGGDRIAVSISFSPVLGSLGDVIGISAVAHDVTAEQQAKRALEDSEHRYRTMFEASPIGMAHADLFGRWLRCSSSLVEMLGYSEEELQRLGVLDICHPEDVQPTRRFMQELVAGTRRRYQIETRYRRKDGTYVWARAHVSLYRDSDQTPRYFIGAIEDISAQRAVQEQLRGTLDRLQAIVSNLPVVLWTLDTAGVFSFAEGQLLPRFADGGTELVGRSILDVYAQNPEACATAERALTGEHVHVIVPIDDMRFEMWYSPLKDQAGQLTGTIGIAIEITERLRLEDQFRQAQKMEAVGRLAGGVAHDFNNLLTAIIGYSELALEPVLPGEAVTGYFEEIHKAARSAAALTRQLLAFSRRQMLQPENIDLNTVVARTLGLLRRLIGEDIELVTKPAANLEPVHADPTQIEQILLNLAVNARDAMPHGGRLVIETANVTLDAAFVERHPGAATGPHVLIAVADTGVGMNNSTRKRLFEPFFTTKERGRGTGLGLSTVYGIVKQSGGYIGVESEPGQGAVFSIYLPAVPEVEAAQLPAADSPQALSGTETILVVEDQVEVRTIARQTLARYGYTVLDAASPDDAIALLESVDTHIHLLFTDVVMPRRSGRALALELLAKRPGLKVIYTSGYADSAIVNQSVLEPGLAFLPKPFSARGLLLKVREVLDADQAASV